MDPRILEDFDSRCAQDTPPACQGRCPVQVEAGTVATLTAEGKTGEARKILERHLPLAPLTAYLCEGPCRSGCLRNLLDAPVDLPMLELHAVRAGRAPKVFPLPSTGKKLSLLGAGLASLVCAFELAKKGHQPVISHLGAPGGRLASEPRLPEGVLGAALSELARLKARLEPAASVGDLASILSDPSEAGFLAVFVDLDDPAMSAEALGLPPEDLKPDPVTQGTTRPGIFLYPGSDSDPNISAITAGKRAAASIDRLLQGADPGVARERERTFESRLVVSLEGRPVVPQVLAADPLAPTASEAQGEAARCLSCTCLACIPPCPFLRERPGHPKKFAREFYVNVVTAFGNRSSNRYINSCAECGLCGQICPTGADLGEFVDLIRQEMVVTNHMPASTFEYPLEDQVFSNGPEAAFWRPAPKTAKSRYLLFPGCQMAASEPGLALALYGHLAAHLDGGVGLWSGCCGAPGRWSGRMGLTSATAEAHRAVWREAGEPEVILACPSCALMFARDIPEIPTTGLWPILSSLPLPEGARPLDGEMTIHDPCAARLDERGQTAVRGLMGRLGQNLHEPRLTGRLTLCCGYGGLVDQAYPELGRRFALQRGEDARGVLLAWCVMCRDRFRGAGMPAVHPLELLFPSPEADALAKPPGLSLRRENRARLRREALSGLWGETIQEDHVTSLRVDIPARVLEDIEARRILVSDVTRVLEAAEAEGPTFHNPETGKSLRSYRPRQVTFWVEYERREDGSYLVHRAWCHRMVLPGVAGEGAESPATLEGFARTGGRV